MKELFDLDSGSLGKGPVVCKWGGKGSLLAVAGESRQVALFNKEGRLMHSFRLDGPGGKSSAAGAAAHVLQWSPKGASIR